MKKYVKYLLPIAVLLALMVILSVTLGSCNYDKKIVGSWQTELYKKDGQKAEKISSDEMYWYEFNSDGTGKLTMPEQGGDLIFEFKWKLDGKKLTVDTLDGDKSEFKIKIGGNKLKLTPARTPDVTYICERM